MSPTATAVLFIIAFIIDFFAIGPAWLQTRLVFMCVVTAVRVGFDDSPLDKWTVDNAAGIIQTGLDQAKGAYVAEASAAAIVGVLVGGLALWAIGAMLPLKASKKLGRIATIQFKETGLRKMTAPVWGLAIPLGLLEDLVPDSWISTAIDFFLGICSFVASPLPRLVFGAA